MTSELLDVILCIQLPTELSSIHSLVNSYYFNVKTYNSLKKWENLIRRVRDPPLISPVIKVLFSSIPAQYQVSRGKHSVHRLTNYCKGQETRKERFLDQWHHQPSEYSPELPNFLCETNKSLLFCWHQFKPVANVGVMLIVFLFLFQLLCTETKVLNSAAFVMAHSTLQVFRYQIWGTFMPSNLMQNWVTLERRLILHGTFGGGKGLLLRPVNPLLWTLLTISQFWRPNSRTLVTALSRHERTSSQWVHYG